MTGGGASLASADSLQQSCSMMMEEYADDLPGGLALQESYEITLNETLEEALPLQEEEERMGDVSYSSSMLIAAANTEATPSAARRRKTSPRDEEAVLGEATKDDDDIEEAANTKRRREGDGLTWSEISMSVRDPDNRNGPAKIILDSVYGKVTPGEVTAIMGTSGSGKTSLLNVLSGRVTSNKTLTVDAKQIGMNGHRIDPTNVQVRQSIAFVAQDDSLQVTATPREAIAFSARLRLSRTLTKHDIDKVTNQMIAELNLQECADTVIGGALIKGISGGERKRTSCAVELVTQPSLIMLDEATSGLDYFNALELCIVLQRVARDGSSILMTIHQPSSDIFKTLDRLILLNKGRVMYEGRCDDVPSYFAERGFPCPEHFNPADWVIGVSQKSTIAELEEAGFFSQDRANRYSIEWSQHKEFNGEDGRHKSVSRRGTVDTVGFWQQTKLLFLRELKNTKRNTHALKARTGMTVAISLLIGIIFFKVAESDFSRYINVQSTFGALLMALLANVFSTVLPSLVTFPEERPVFLREYSTKHYSVAAYFFSRFTMELLVTAVQVTTSSLITYFMIGFSGNYGYFWAVLYSLAMTSTAIGVLIGCSVADPSLAIEFLPAVFMPQILFAGFFVPPELLPNWLKWIVYIFPLTYATRLALIWEFETACDGLMPNFCHAIMRSVEAYPEDTWWYWLILLCMFVVFRLLALFILRRKASKFY